jgi:uncharacterized protein (TIGR02453 family)
MASYFTDETFTFLRDLKQNNSRDWFTENRHRYDAYVKEPAIRFIMDFDPLLHRISAHYRADPRPVGGSLFRIHRDTRFSKDKDPYKTHAGIRFPHGTDRNVHAPGFYLHIEPESVFVGIGIWHPDGPTLKKIRDAIVEDPKAWKAARDAKRLRARFELGGESLTRPPRGYDPEHPFTLDIKRKDFIASCKLEDEAVSSPGFVRDFATICSDGAPLVRWLCGAIGLPF